MFTKKVSELNDLFTNLIFILNYLPKSSSFDDVSKKQIEQIEFAPNHRPRKTLGQYTPSEVMAGFYTVALAA